MARTDRPLPRPELEKDNPPAPQPYRRRRPTGRDGGEISRAHRAHAVPKPYATLATLTVHHASFMTPFRRQEIAAWLRRQADDLQREGTNYSRRYRARYQTR